MKERKKVKTGIVLLLLFLAAGLVLQPSQASELQCGIWCPYCAKWQESYTCSLPPELQRRGMVSLLISCGDCAGNLLRVQKGADTDTTNSGTDEEASTWYESCSVERCHPNVVFPCALAYLEGGSDTDDSYHVTADKDLFGSNEKYWTRRETYEEAWHCLKQLFDSLYDWSVGEFTWSEWYHHGLTVNSSGEKSSPLMTYMNRFGIKAVLKEELTPPILTIEGDASVQIYRNGTQVTGEVKAGDVVQLTPVKTAGREYADYTISENAENLNWEEELHQLSFTMPAGEVSVSIGYWELLELQVELAPLFYETYQKEPYWDGQCFNVDCEPAVAVGADMLEVNALVRHSRTLEEQKRAVSAFSITDGEVVYRIGEHTILVSADVFQDGYLLEGDCRIKTGSASLKELMERTGSQTYTELRQFVESLMDKLAAYEQMIEELSENLKVSEEQRAESERKLAEALEELELLTENLQRSEKQIKEMSGEIEALTAQLKAASEELAAMRETMTSMQEFLQQITGETEIDKELLEKAKTEFETLKEQKEDLAEAAGRLENERERLSSENGSLTAENKRLAEKCEALEKEGQAMERKAEALREEMERLEREKDALMEKNIALSEQLKDTQAGQQHAQEEYGRLRSQYEALHGERNSMGEQLAGLLQENTELTERMRVLETEKLEWKSKYEKLSAAGCVPEKWTEAPETAAAAEAESEELAAKAELETESESSVLEEPGTEKVTSVEAAVTEENQKKQTEAQNAGRSVSDRLAAGVMLVAAAMLLGGAVLYISLEPENRLTARFAKMPR